MLENGQLYSIYNASKCTMYHSQFRNNMFTIDANVLISKNLQKRQQIFAAQYCKLNIAQTLYKINMAVQINVRDIEPGDISDSIYSFSLFLMTLS
jgi:hypothetical protein